MSRWRPSPDEERWLEVASELKAAVPASALTERTGGWRTTGPLARIALFVLGLVAAALLYGIFFVQVVGVTEILGFGVQIILLVAGLVIALAAEWLTFRKRLYASGVEEGLSVAGFLLIGAWIARTSDPSLAGPTADLIQIAAVGAAGLRRLNPFVTTGAVIAFVHWAGRTAVADALDRAIGTDMTVLALGCALAALALALGARSYRRPSHDRMLDWTVATLPIAAWLQQASLSAFDPSYAADGTGTTRLAAVVLLLALGAALLITGLKRRSHAPLWGFLGCVVGLAAELRAAIPVAPETWLIACGLVALVVGATLDRYLRQPRNGLTSTPLSSREGPLDLLQIAGAALLARRAGPAAPPAEPGFEGGGGKFGGGGASSRY